MADERTDAELLLASKAAPSAFVELYRRHAEDVLRYFAKRTLDPEAAAELTAETFAQAFASRGSYRDTGANGVAWIYGIAKHQMGRFFRAGTVDREARKKLGMPIRDLDPEDYERIEDLVDLAPIREALREAMAGLPDEQRAALELRVIDELPYPTVAERLGLRRGGGSTTGEPRPAAARARPAGAGADDDGGRGMTTRIPYLEKLEADIQRAATKAVILQPPLRRGAAVWGRRLGAVAAVLAVAVVIGSLAGTGGLMPASERCVRNVQPGRHRRRWCG